MKLLLFFTFIFIALACILSPCQCMMRALFARPRNTPIVFVPGVLGSPLMSVNTKTHRAVCQTGFSQPYSETTTWLSKLRMLFPTQCLRNELKLTYNHDTKTFQENNKNVRTVVPGFGETTGIEYIDSQSILPLAKYYKPSVDYFVSRGYTRGLDLVGAPYDWRYAPDMLDELGFYDNFKKLIEQTYKNNGDTRVAIVAHSMGAPVSHYFLTNYKKINQDWKNKHVDYYIPVAPAFDGGAASLQALISGYHKVPRIPYLHTVWNDFVVDLSRSFESVNFLVPLFSGKDMIITPNKRYGVKNLDKLYQDIGYTNGPYFEDRILSIKSRVEYPAPNVDTVLYEGIGVKTPETFEYDRDFGKGVNTVALRPTITYGDGDGTVNRHSAEIVAKDWSLSKKMEFTLVSLQGASHMSILRDERLLSHIFGYLGKNTDNTILGRLKKILLMKSKIERLQEELVQALVS